MRNAIKLISLLSIISTSYAASATNADQILCKINGKKIAISKSTALNECFDALYWGEVCYTGNYNKAVQNITALLPIQTKSQKISYIARLNKKIIYLSEDLNSEEYEGLTIERCNSRFLK